MDTPDGRVAQALSSHPDVAFAHVADRDGRRVAAIVPHDFCSAPQLRNLALDAAGDGVPTVLVVAPGPPDGDTNVWLDDCLSHPDRCFTLEPPRSPLEEELCSIWEEALGEPVRSVSDDFLDLGGDSLQAIEITYAVAERLDVGLDVVELFDANNLRGLAEIVERRRSGG